MPTATELLAHLESTGTGKTKLDLGRQLLRDKPSITGEDMLRMLAGKAWPDGTVEKAKVFLGQVEQPETAPTSKRKRAPSLKQRLKAIRSTALELQQRIRAYSSLSDADYATIWVSIRRLFKEAHDIANDAEIAEPGAFVERNSRDEAISVAESIRIWARDQLESLPNYGRNRSPKAQNPKPQKASSDALGHARKSPAGSSSGHTIDVAIVVPLREEFEQLYGEIKSNYEPIRDSETGSYFYEFDRPSSGVATYRCITTFVGELGERKAGLLTQRILMNWEPATVVVLGIAASLSNDVAIGDVVAATAVDSYLENSKAIDSASDKWFEFQLSGEIYRPSVDLVSAVRHLPFAHRSTFDAWQDAANKRMLAEVDASELSKLLNNGLVRRKPTITDGHVASGPTVAGSRAFVKFIKQRDRKYLALEMESGGVMAAVYEVSDPKRSLVLRGISDYGDDRKEELDRINAGGLRRYGVQNAIHLLWQLMELDVLPRAGQARDSKVDSRTSAVFVAEKAWEDGFNYIATKINVVLAERAPGLKIKVEEHPRGLTFALVRQRFLNAVAGIRPLALDLPRDDQLEPWSLGYANDRNNHPLLIGGSGYSTDEAIDRCLSFLSKRDWDVDRWKSNIVDGVVSHAEGMRTWFNELKSTRSGNQTSHEV